MRTYLIKSLEVKVDEKGDCSEVALRASSSSSCSGNLRTNFSLQCKYIIRYCSELGELQQSADVLHVVSAGAWLDSVLGQHAIRCLGHAAAAIGRVGTDVHRHENVLDQKPRGEGR
eukprot:TRINITY_DN4554_c0_g1_i6.p1 TRINITY_DN4554_c0_g1~~TRINITY_DN4554_c0_g1_i6.p1  ORF type:complete len:116 (-),score=23.93 TRINITY_DN4554_c0_g1_i6:58-405(-)